MNKNYMDTVEKNIRDLAISLIMHGKTRDEAMSTINELITNVYDNKNLVLDTLRNLIDNVNKTYNDGRGMYGICRVSFNPASIMFPDDPAYINAIAKADGPVVVVEHSVNAVAKKKKDFGSIIRTRKYILIDIDQCNTDEERVLIINQINAIMYPDQYASVPAAPAAQIPVTAPEAFSDIER